MLKKTINIFCAVMVLSALFSFSVYAEEISLFDPYNLTFKSNISEEELGLIFKDTGLEGLEGDFLAAQETHGVNVIFLASVGILESGWGNSSMAKNKNNLFGYGKKRFDSKSECIDAVAEGLATYYLSRDGKYFKGTTVNAVSKYYCQGSKHWISSIKRLMVTINDKIVEERTQKEWEEWKARIESDDEFAAKHSRY